MDHIWSVPHFPKPSQTLMIEKYMSTVGGKGTIQAIACTRLSRARPEPVSAAKYPTARRNSAWSQHTFGARSRILNAEDINIEVSMVGAVGNDQAGNDIVQTLKANGLNIQGVLKCDNAITGTASIALENSGENNVLVYPGANHRLTVDQIRLNFDNSPPHLLILQMEIPMATVEHVVKCAARKRIPILLNAAPAGRLHSDIYPCLEHLIVNKVEAEDLLGQHEDSSTTSSQHLEDHDRREAEMSRGRELCQGLLDLNVRHVVVTLGGFGGVAGTNTSGGVPSIIEYAAQQVDNVVDTTGSGGVFIGAYAVDYIRQCATSGQFNIERAAKWAAKAAALKVQHRGSLSGIPYEDDLEPA